MRTSAYDPKRTFASAAADVGFAEEAEVRITLVKLPPRGDRARWIGSTSRHHPGMSLLSSSHAAPVHLAFC
jgi:hypothetical protein